MIYDFKHKYECLFKLRSPTLSIKDVNYISRSVLFHYSKSSVKWKYLCKKREVTSSGDVNMSVSSRFLPPSAHQVGLVKLISGREIPAVIVFLSGIRDLI